MLTYEGFTKLVQSGHYKSEVNARRAVYHTKLGKNQKAQALRMINIYFKGLGEKPVTSTRKKNGRRLAGAVFGTNGVKLNGEGDCLAVAACELACNKEARDIVNRLLSLAREENVTLPELSARFARICHVVSKV